MTSPALSRGCFAFVALLALGCSTDPDVKAREHAAKADAYVANRQYTEAIIEYRNALKARPERADLHHKLGKAYLDAGDPAKAYGAYARAADLDPANVEAQIQTGALLVAAGEFERARTRAELALKADPKSTAAHILLGNALAGLKDSKRALQEIEQAIALDPASAPAWTALGAVQFSGGGRARAGESFQKAVALAPNAVEPRLALANYQWAQGDVASAERALKDALAIDRDSAVVHRSLALLYLATQRPHEAEPHFVAVAAKEPSAKLTLADYYVGMNRREDALRVLGDIEQGQDKQDVRAAKLRRASLEFSAGRKDEAHGILDALVAEKPRNVEVRVAKARILLADDGRAKEAIDHAREAVKIDSGSAAAQYTLGQALLATSDVEGAEAAFRQVLEVNPRASVARLQLARLQLARGEPARAYATAEEAARQRPDDPSAAVLMARSLRAQGDLARAHRELTATLARYENVPDLHVEAGWVALGRRDHEAAAASFAEAVKLAPRLHDARVGLVTVDIAQGQAARARERLTGWLAESPGDVRLRVLSARTHLVAGRPAEAEQELRDVVTADASQLEAYDLLGRIYVSKGQLDRALAEYDVLAGRTPHPAGVRTMIGMIHEARHDRAAARGAYEQALAADPKAGVAANNLAWLLAQDGRLDDALRLATTARDALRNRPEAEDTLGWIYYRKDLPGHAIPAFQRAIDRAPENPTYHYHLGLAHLRAGNDKQGRAALQRALALKPDFNGADDARARLAAPANEVAGRSQ